MYYQILTDNLTHVDILPALGTHKPMTREQQLEFFGNTIPESRFLTHNWRSGVVALGKIPQNVVQEISQGWLNSAIPVEVSGYLKEDYDLIISIGQVMPHEVVGMANYTKNIVIGCGGAEFINASHMLGAFYGIEKTLGEIDTPVRRLFDYAQEHFINKLPIDYVLTVTSGGVVNELHIGKCRSIFEQAATASQLYNITYVEKLQYCVAYLPPTKYHSTWLGNKAVYRTRLAMADGGELLVIAPGVTSFGEDMENDKLIRKYGYCGRENVIALCKTEPDLVKNLSAAAHLIHGSTDGRFNVTYAAPQLGREAVEGVGYKYMDIKQARAIMEGLQPGVNAGDMYYISDPGAGLWKY